MTQPTSLLAADRIEPHAGTLRAKVLSFIRQAPFGATDEEMQLNLDLNPSTQRPRRIELVKAGFVRNSGMVRLTESGCRAVVWEAAMARWGPLPV